MKPLLRTLLPGCLVIWGFIMLQYLKPSINSLTILHINRAMTKFRQTVAENFKQNFTPKLDQTITSNGSESQSGNSSVRKLGLIAPDNPKLLQFLTPIEDCLIREAFRNGTKLWTIFNKAVNLCLPKIGQNGGDGTRLDVRLLNNADDTKGFIPMDHEFTNNTSCVIVTLGVGNDIRAEKQIQTLAPHCQFYGADPILQSGKVYKSIGEYDQLAVSTHDGMERASVLQDGSYRWLNLTTISLVRYLQQHNITVVDDLLIDNEGPEYKLMPYLHRQGPLGQAGITICQLNMEVHCMPSKYGMPDDQFDQLMIDFWIDSPFWPVWSSKGCHNRYYFVNFESQECVKRYFKS